MSLILLNILLYSSIISAAHSVLIPERVDDLSEHCLQLAKALARNPRNPICMQTCSEFNIYYILSYHAKKILGDQAWPIPAHRMQQMGWGERRCTVFWPIVPRRRLCAIPRLKRSYDESIKRVRSGWHKSSLSSDALLVYKKTDKIEQTADLVTNMIDFFSQDNPDLKHAIRCVKNWKGLDGKKHKKPSLLIEVDKLAMVQEVFDFELVTE